MSVLWTLLLIAPLFSGGFRATVSWTENGGDSFRIERRDDPGVAWTAIGVVQAGARSFVDESVAAGSSYCWRVVAVSGAFEAASREACAAVPQTVAEDGFYLSVSVVP